MKITKGSLEGLRVKQVRLDGRVVHNPVAFDTDEGWVEALVPRKNQVRVLHQATQTFTTEGEQIPETEWVEVRWKGQIGVDLFTEEEFKERLKALDD